MAFEGKGTGRMAAKQQFKKKRSKKNRKIWKEKQPKRLKQKPKVSMDAKANLQVTENKVAATNAMMALKDDICCSICLDPFHDPVIIQCGHSFCRTCITTYWKGSFLDACCPLCRTLSPTKQLIPNRHLETILENYKKLGLENDKNTGRALVRNETKKFGVPAVFDSSVNMLLKPNRYYQTASNVSGSRWPHMDYGWSSASVKNKGGYWAATESNTSVKTGLGIFATEPYRLPHLQFSSTPPFSFVPQRGHESSRNAFNSSFRF